MNTLHKQITEIQENVFQLEQRLAKERAGKHISKTEEELQEIWSDLQDLKTEDIPTNEDIQNAEELLGSVVSSCHEGIEGTWDKSDEGLEAMASAVEQACGLLSINCPWETSIVETYLRVGLNQNKKTYETTNETRYTTIRPWPIHLQKEGNEPIVSRG